MIKLSHVQFDVGAELVEEGFRFETTLYGYEAVDTTMMDVDWLVLEVVQ